MILRRVKPNRFYGFRTPKTLSDERIWYEANEYAGKLLLAMGLICMAAAILLYLIPGVRADMVVYNLTYSAVLLACLFSVVFLSLRYLQSL